jgi:tyrosine-specific transport protein
MKRKFPVLSIFLSSAVLHSAPNGSSVRAFLAPTPTTESRSLVHRRPQSRLFVSTSTPQDSSPSALLLTDDLAADGMLDPRAPADENIRNIYNERQPPFGADPDTVATSLLSKLQEKIGVVDDSRLIFPELSTGEVDRLFSSLEYAQSQSGQVTSVARASASVFGAAALIAGTTVGAGILALPTATAAAGFLPSSAALIVAWVYMTFSGLLIAELTLNRLGTSGRPGLGLLELYKGSLGQTLGQIGTAAYFFLHYSMMVAYIAQGGVNVESFLGSVGLQPLVDTIPGLGPLAFASTCAVTLFAASSAWVERANNVLVLGVAATFLAIVGIGAGSADFGALLDMSNQHPEQVVNCFPILFLALVYQNVVPTIVTQLEGNRSKIIQAVVGGTTLPLLMFLAWNAVVLGNVYGSGGLDFANQDPVALLQSGAAANSAALGPLVSAFSSLALVTSVIGFTYGLIDAWTDMFQVSTQGKEFEKWKLPLFGLVFAPPLVLSMANPDIFYHALEYGGAFGVSTLFLVLPPIMVWKERYGKEEKPLITKPMVPFGKLALGSMWKAAGTLILEQGAEKLGLFDFIQHLSTPPQ